MESSELGCLELQIDRLLQIIGDLQVENNYLRNQMVRHSREKSAWYQNNRQTVCKIKKIINNLQEALG
jgi:uncharacterized protein (TIGR02449 family)